MTNLFSAKDWEKLEGAAEFTETSFTDTFEDQ